MVFVSYTYAFFESWVFHKYKLLIFIIHDKMLIYNKILTYGHSHKGRWAAVVVDGGVCVS